MSQLWRRQSCSGRGLRALLLVSLLLFLLSLPSGAHVPVVPGDDHGSVVITVPDPLKSWAFYATLHDVGEQDLYRFGMHQGDRLVVSLQVPDPVGPVPVLVIMGPGLSPSGTSPPGVEVPPGSAAVVLPGVRPSRPSYEPFAPGASYPVADLDTVVSADGEYRVAVVGSGEGIRYGLAIGYREEFSPAEWVLVPLSVLQARVNEGQHPALVLAPLLLVLAGGLLLLSLKRKGYPRLHSAAGWCAATAGLLMLGSAAVTLVQMGMALAATGPTAAAAVTAVFILLAALPGILCLRVALARIPASGGQDRIILLTSAILSLAFWSGLLAGPVLALAAAALARDRPVTAA
jgi:hypothetical protein